MARGSWCESPYEGMVASPIPQRCSLSPGHHNQKRRPTRGELVKNLAKTYGPWAVVTGASSGIGQEFARRLAADGVNLVLAARRIGRLEALAAELEQAHGIEVRPVQADLGHRGGVDAIEKAVADVDLAIVISNAGAAHPGAFLRTDVDGQLAMVGLNVTTPVDIAHRLGQRLVDRGRGAIVFVGSTSTFAGVPMLSSYAAAKAFVGAFAEGLYGEWRKHGVDVLVVHPGPTRTEMVQTDGVDFGAMPMNWMQPDQVAMKTFRALGRKPSVFPGAINKVQRFIFTRLVPRRTTSAVLGGLMRNLTAEELR